MRTAALLSIALICAAAPAAALPPRPASDAYIGCIAAKTAIAMRQMNHGAPEDQAAAAAKIAAEKCERLFPKHLSTADGDDLTAEANDIIQRLTAEPNANQE
jgi:hypothetical protein